MSLCTRCRKSKALSGKALCGICEIVVSGSMLTELPAAVPGHFNYGYGQYIENRDHLKKVQKEQAGVLSPE